MPAPEVWFAIPSASPERCKNSLPEWRARGYKIAILQNRVKAEIPADIVVWRDSYPGWAESINILCREVVPKSAAIVVSGGDDMFPDPNHTAQELAEQFLEHFKDSPGGTFGVMQPHGDEFANTRHYCGSPWLGREWINSMYQGRGPMCGQYRHNWGDVELYWVARCLDALWERPDLTQYHAHFRRGEDTKKPRWWVENVERNDRHDVELCIQRTWMRFPGHEPIGVQRQFNPEPLLNDTVRLAEKHHASLYGANSIYARSPARMTDALSECSKRRLTPVAIYGSGTHTRAGGEALREPTADVACIIDDHTERQGRRMWNYPIVSQQEAIAIGVRAVILSSDEYESRMWDQRGPLVERGIHVLRLYNPGPLEKNRRATAAIADLTRRGKTRIAFYGAGAHSADLGPAIESGGGRVVAFIDDNPSRAGQALHGLPIVTPDQAPDLSIDAVVLSTDRFEAELWEKTTLWRENGVEIVPLYLTTPADRHLARQFASGMVLGVDVETKNMPLHPSIPSVTTIAKAPVHAAA
ncbi:MAG: hypothetical protein SFZ23_03150 [Planctomycetota bacterium]|nr:hypothetical protein [Planctomycetota bacterium]